MGEVASTKLLLSTSRPGPFISGSSHAILTLGQRPIIGGVLCASILACSACVGGLWYQQDFLVPVGSAGCVTRLCVCTWDMPILACKSIRGADSAESLTEEELEEQEALNTERGSIAAVSFSH